MPVGLALDAGGTAAISAESSAFIGVDLLGGYERRAFRIPAVSWIGRGELDMLRIVLVDGFWRQESPGFLDGNLDSATTWWEERGIDEGLLKEGLYACLAIGVRACTLD